MFALISHSTDRLLTALLAHVLALFGPAAGRRVRDTRGASAVEYGLLVAGIAAVVLVGVFALGDTVREVFTGTCEQIAGQTQPDTTTNCT